MEPKRPAAIRRLCERASLGRQILLRPGYEVVDGPGGQHRICPEHLVTEHHTTGRNLDEHECEAVDVVGSAQVRQIAKPPLKRLPVRDPHAHIDAAGEPALVAPFVTLRVDGRKDFVKEWRLGALVTAVRGP